MRNLLLAFLILPIAACAHAADANSIQKHSRFEAVCGSTRDYNSFLCIKHKEIESRWLIGPPSRPRPHLS